MIVCWKGDFSILGTKQWKKYLPKNGWLHSYIRDDKIFPPNCAIIENKKIFKNTYFFIALSLYYFGTQDYLGSTTEQNRYCFVIYIQILKLYNLLASKNLLILVDKMDLLVDNSCKAKYNNKSKCNNILFLSLIDKQSFILYLLRRKIVHE